VFPYFFVVRRSARKGKNKREDVKLVEEEVYNIDEGWKIELDSTEKVRKSLLLLPLISFCVHLVYKLLNCQTKYSADCFSALKASLRFCNYCCNCGSRHLDKIA
jgi:hypothetical protein